MNDIPLSPYIELALFADDTSAAAQNEHIVENTHALQNYLNSLEEWLIKWKIKINPEKSAICVFTRKKNFSNFPIYIFDSPIPYVNSYKYLGVTLEKRLLWTEHINNTLTKAKAIYSQLYPLLKRGSSLSLKNKLLLYTMVIRPVITYACPIWANSTKTNISKLQTLQNKILRTCVNAEWYVRNSQIHNDLKIPPLFDYFKRISRNFYNSIPATENPTLLDIESYNPFTPLHRKRPLALLVQEREPFPKKPRPILPAQQPSPPAALTTPSAED